MEITESKRIEFVRAYLDEGFSSTAAAKAIGYSTRNAKVLGEEILLDPDTQDLIKHEQYLRNMASRVSREYVLTVLYEATEIARAEGNVKDLDRLGNSLARILGMTDPKHSGDLGLKITLKQFNLTGINHDISG